MKKKIKNILIILILSAMVINITYSYAFENTNTQMIEKESFFEISSTQEVTIGEQIEMVLNLEEIDYSKFEFSLVSSEKMEEIEVKNNELNLEQIEQTNNEINFEINKETTNLNEIVLYYKVPETLEAGDTIQFIATIKDTSEDTKQEDDNTKTQSLQENSNTLNNEVNNNNAFIDESNKTDNTTQDSKENTQTVTLEVMIIENSSNTSVSTEESKNEENTQDMQINQLVNSSTSVNTNVNVEESINTVTTTASITSSSSIATATTQTVVYNGSCNNYLSKLSINGYELSNSFSKDNSTYFVTVSNDVDSLEIETEAEEDDAIIYVYGNEDLQEGTNKILICVTAENGNVRNYRIYVIKNS